jgi:hypothetical protein
MNKLASGLGVVPTVSDKHGPVGPILDAVRLVQATRIHHLVVDHLAHKLFLRFITLTQRDQTRVCAIAPDGLGRFMLGTHASIRKETVHS